MTSTGVRWDGATYDRTRRADPALADLLRGRLAVAAGLPCLDLACGTGNYTIALRKLGVAMIGIDASMPMLRQARTKAPEAMWACADAMRLPFADQIFGGALCTLAIHHLADLGAAFAEVARVQAEGRFIVFTAWPEQMRAYWLNHCFPVAMARSISQMPARPTVLRALDTAGFEVVDEEPWWVPPEPVDLFLYAGKHRPELYLDPAVRAGISTFTGLAEPAELETGLATLEADIASRRIDRVIAAHPDQAGDYVLVVARLRDGQ